MSTCLPWRLFFFFFLTRLLLNPPIEFVQFIKLSIFAFCDLQLLIQIDAAPSRLVFLSKFLADNYFILEIYVKTAQKWQKIQIEMSCSAVLPGNMMAAGGEVGHERGIWTACVCWQWWMLALKYSISDHLLPPPGFYLYIHTFPTKLGPFWTNLIRRLPYEERNVLGGRGWDEAAVKDTRLMR